MRPAGLTAFHHSGQNQASFYTALMLTKTGAESLRDPTNCSRRFLSCNRKTEESQTDQ
jgi:hypothetical protein